MANTKITSKVIADANILTAAIADNAVTGDKVADDVALAGNPTTTTQTAGNSTTRIATTAFVSTAISNLVDSSPSALNTLNELAAALGDDANFSTTVTNSIATKLPLAGGTMTGNIAHASHFTIDAGGDIHLDTGGQVKLDLNGTLFGNLFPSSGDFGIHVAQQDKDLIISGNDGGSSINALVLDMSNGGRANFNNDIGLNDDRGVRFGSNDDSVIYNDNSNLYIKNSTTNQDIIFQGNDDGSTITALTLDMSDAGSCLLYTSDAADE